MMFFMRVAVLAAPLLWGQAPLTGGGFDDREIGRWIYAGVFAVLLVWLMLLPRERIGQTKAVPPWWRNVRVWAVFVTVAQLLVYLLFSY